ncbi:MAG: alpha-L-arabinofuranosidase [Butyrivibrio sp.]|nr:alpha-L-arabinofuranosidase [Butyrivibrio sp.]
MIDKLIAHYPFDDPQNIGKDDTGNGHDAIVKGEKAPIIKTVSGRIAANFAGGPSGSSYLELPKDLFVEAGDEDGLTISAWVCTSKATSVWERIFDFGNSCLGPYLFLTRDLRGVVFKGSEIPAAGSKGCSVGEWVHIAMTITGTKNGTIGNAGPRIYRNGELVADGLVSQTSSGTYKLLREWLASLKEEGQYVQNFIGHSQFDADDDFSGAISDFSIYGAALTENDIIELMCQSLTDEQILKLSEDKFLKAPAKIITGDIELQKELLGGKVQVKWTSSRPENLSDEGKLIGVTKTSDLVMKAELSCGKYKSERLFYSSLIPEDVCPYELTVHGDNTVLDISKTLYGLFFEDINRCADGGIYAEMVQNRSFEEFEFDTYDARSGENGVSTGRKHDPLKYWFGDIDKVTPSNKNNLGMALGCKDPDTNAYYVEMPFGTSLYNRGFCDNNMGYAMRFHEEETYFFTIYAKTAESAAIKVQLLDENGDPVSDEYTINVKGNKWKKYKADKLVAKKTAKGQLKITVCDNPKNESASSDGSVCVDMISLMPGNVWGAKKEKISTTAHANYKGNPNYRLRKDLVETLADMNPTFLRFPGGCISEGSYIWDNVYDWKDSVGDVAVRKENFNVWGYTMTLGLGYMEYFQLAEDLGAEPLPVMACGVLCQARSDYANPAGGKLRKKYISNFIDLIDFALSTDFENNKWAELRKEMGHEEPFGLHYLGVGNENWGTEFFANFEIFYKQIMRHIKKYYPDQGLVIVSTAGAQADDDAYQNGWKFLAGYNKGKEKIAFSDGVSSKKEEITFYENKKDYMDTIVDEHYYRSNEYLLENADRYNYYSRAYRKGALDEAKTPKVFVGEYASNDKNTLAGAIAEAAVMTGFENNSDVVRLAATAPLFNHIGTDGTYRWTPDCIWFDEDTIWKTPTYYVQQLFAKYLGNKLVSTEFATYDMGTKKTLYPHGGVVIEVEGEIILKSLKVVSNITKETLFEQDFAKALDNRIKFYTPVQGEKVRATSEGIQLSGNELKGLYIDESSWKNISVSVVYSKAIENASLGVGAGLCLKDGIFAKETMTAHVYHVGDAAHGTGMKVYKEGKEAYTMGDYSSSVYTGNLRACFNEEIPVGTQVNVNLNFGGNDGKSIQAYYVIDKKKEGNLTYKLEEYNRDVYSSVTRDDEYAYIKLVNADDFDKKINVKFKGVKTSSKAEVVTLTAGSEFVHVPNVNVADEEKVTPVVSDVVVKKSGVILELKANSLNVIKIKIK